MKFSRSQLVCVFVAVIVLFFSGNEVKCVPIIKTVPTGGTILLRCFPQRNDVNGNSWYRNRTLIANKRGSIDRLRITQIYKDYQFDSRFSDYKLSIAAAKIGDSAIYYCANSQNYTIKSYDVRVVGCSNCFLTFHSSKDKEKVMCNLDNYRASQQFRRHIILRGGGYKEAVIQGNVFSFPIDTNELSELDSEFHLNLETDTSVTCMLLTLPPTSQPSTSCPTTTTKQTTLTRKSDNSRSTSTTSQELSPGRTFPIVKHHTSINKSTNTDNNGTGNIMIISISGSVFILLLIVLVVVLRCKQKKNHQENKHNSILSVDDKDTKEYPEACYESVEDASQRGLQKSTSNEKIKDTSKNQPRADHHGGMVDNILYDSSDKIAEGSISRTEGPLDNALYAMPDKRKTLDRESKSGAVGGSPAADILYGNSSIIISQEQKRDTLQRGDQYENIEMPGLGGGAGAEEIPLYEMPDKAPQRNTLKATPKAEQTSTAPKEEMVNVNALYAEVDKTKKK